MLLDQFKLNHWTNARKLTPTLLAERADVPLGDVRAMLAGAAVDDRIGTAVAGALDVPVARLEATPAVDATVVVRTAAQLAATRRPIERDGIHFYNYYTMAAGPGRVAPVVLDILCPAGRLPALNNGHLEPAITVNLGPGDIHGRWGTALTPATWQLIAANRDADGWIVGESYVEPPHCPHTYSLAGDTPARIVSYTGHANLAPLVEELNTWTEAAFARFVEALTPEPSPGRLADLLLAARGTDRAGAAAVLGTDEAALDAALAAPLGHVELLCRLGAALGLDYRLLLPPARRHDAAGKTYLSLADTRRSVRRFRGYDVASTAAAPHVPDLSGLFVRVGGDGGDLAGPNETHYLVVDGTPTVEWTDATGRPATATLDPDGSAWVAPFVAHRWRGTGAVLRLSSGAHLATPDLFELSGTVDAAATVRRSRRDLRGWGYDS